jgi:hypothetical protein
MEEIRKEGAPFGNRHAQKYDRPGKVIRLNPDDLDALFDPSDVKGTVQTAIHHYGSQIRQTLEVFLASPDFEDGVIASTKASWAGDSYLVDLHPDGTWEVYWSCDAHQPVGIARLLPTLDVDADEMAEYINGGGTEDEYLRECFDVEQDELIRSFR